MGPGLGLEEEAGEEDIHPAAELKGKEGTLEDLHKGNQARGKGRSGVHREEIRWLQWGRHLQSLSISSHATDEAQAQERRRLH